MKNLLKRTISLVLLCTVLFTSEGITSFAAEATSTETTVEATSTGESTSGTTSETATEDTTSSTTTDTDSVDTSTDTATDTTTDEGASTDEEETPVEVTVEDDTTSTRIPLDEVTEEMTGGDPEWYKYNGYPEMAAGYDYLYGDSDSDSTVLELNGDGLSNLAAYDVPEQYQSGYKIAGGIDVSYYQGNIDWASVKAAGIEFAFIRAGYRSYGSTGALHSDSKVDTYISEAKAAGIKVGLYVFSQALNSTEAEAEAKLAIQYANTYGIDLPIVMDYEYYAGGRFDSGTISKATATANAIAFCKTVKNAGYEPCVYGSRTFLYSQIDAASIDDSYYIWLANYTSGGASPYSGDYAYWQCSSSGSVSGISGNVDLDLWFAKQHTITIKNCDSKYGAYNLPSTTMYEGYSYTLKTPRTTSSDWAFFGWYTDSKFKNKITSISKWNKSDITIYARWGIKVTLDANGGICDDDWYVIDPTLTGTDDKPYANLYTPVRAGYNFTGWLADDGTTIITADSPLYSKKGHTLTAQWKLTREMDDPTASITSGSTVNYGTELELLSSVSNSTIYYTMTTDGTTPADPVTAADATTENPASDIYCEPFELTTPGTVTIKAVCTKNAYLDSNVVTFTYTVSEATEDSGDITDDDKDLAMENVWTSAIADQTYTGAAITPTFNVYWNKKLLTLNTDYKLTYKNNKNAGTATVIVTGKNSFSGSFVRTFTINPKDMTTEFSSLGEVVVAYNGKKAQSPSVTVYDGKTKLAVNKGYTLSWTNDNGEEAKGCIAAGNYTVTITGKGNYTGSGTFNFKILKSDQVRMADVKVSSIANQNYTGEAIEPALTIKYKGTLLEEGADKDYTIESWDNNINVGTATVTIKGTGSTYYGTRTITFKIVSTPMSKVKFTYDKTQAVAASYTGSGQTITGYTLSYNGVELVEGTDYDIVYQDTKGNATNIKANKAAVAYFVGKGYYTGSVKKTFKISAYTIQNAAAATSKTAAKEATVTVELDKTASNYADSMDFTTGQFESYYYTKGGVKPKVVVTDNNGNVLTEGTDYTLSYKNNNQAAKYNGDNPYILSTVPTVIITGKGNYTGTFTKQFGIAPGNLKNLSANVTVADLALNTKKAKNYATTVTITDSNGKKLVAGTDYKVVYYYAEDTAVFCGSSAVLRSAYTTSPEDDKTYEATSTDRLTSAATMIAQIVGLNNYAEYGATLNYTYNVYSKKIANATATIATQAYTGKAITLKHSQIVLKYGKTQLSNSDFEIVSYSNNVNAGTASVTIRGLHDYGGTKTIKFKISAQNINYTIVYDKNDEEATGTMKNSVLASGAKLAGVGFKKKNYVFAGWSLTSSGEIVYANKAAFYQSGTKFEAGSTITLYAQWKPAETKINYVLNGGTNNASNPATHNTVDAATLLAPTRTGYTFGGWYLNKKLTGDPITSVKAGTKAVTVYAKWIEDTSENHDLFVSPKGNDSNDGTADHPFKTVQKALDTVKAGQTIYLRKGTYKENLTFASSGEADNLITLTCYPKEKAIITTKSGTDGAAISTNGQSYITITGLYITGVTGLSVCGIELTGGETNITISNNDISKIKTTGKDSTANANGILVAGQTATAISDVTITGNAVHNNTNGYSENITVVGNCKNITVSNNKVYSNTNIGIDFAGNYGTYTGSTNGDTSLDMPRNCTCTGNTVYSNKSKIAACAGIYVDGARDITISGNTVYGNQYGIEIGAEQWNESYDSTRQVSGIQITGNTIYNNLFEAIRVGGYTTDDTTGTVTDVTITGNIIKNDSTSLKTDGYEINLAKCSSVTISSNKFYMKNTAFAILHYDLGETYSTSIEFTSDSNYLNGELISSL